MPLLIALLDVFENSNNYNAKNDLWHLTYKYYTNVIVSKIFSPIKKYLSPSVANYRHGHQSNEEPEVVGGVLAGLGPGAALASMMIITWVNLQS